MHNCETEQPINFPIAERIKRTGAQSNNCTTEQANNCTKEQMHMRTIALSCNKGGVGKTTLTKHLAAMAATSGLNVLIFDMDQQNNSRNWFRRRSKRKDVADLALVPARFVTENDLKEALEEARALGCNLVLFDTPPGRSAETLAAIEEADLVLIPFWLDKDAFDGVEKTYKAASLQGKPAIGVLNFATPNSQSHINDAHTVLESLGVPMSPKVVHRYDAYRLANPPGQTVQEREPNSIAAAEIAELWNWVSTEMQLGTGAVVHNGAAA